MVVGFRLAVPGVGLLSWSLCWWARLALRVLMAAVGRPGLLVPRPRAESGFWAAGFLAVLW